MSQAAFDSSWVHDELKSVRNVRPAAHQGLGMIGTFLYYGVVHYFLRGREPFTLSHGGADHEREARPRTQHDLSLSLRPPRNEGSWPRFRIPE